MGCPTVKEILEEEEGAVLKERVDSCAPERGGLCSVIGTVAVFCFQKGILLRSGIILTVKMKTAAATSFSSFLPVSFTVSKYQAHTHTHTHTHITQKHSTEHKLPTLWNFSKYFHPKTSSE